MLHGSRAKRNGWALSGTRPAVQGGIKLNNVKRQCIILFPLKPLFAHMERDISIAVISLFRSECR